LKRVCPNAIITVENPATGYLQYFEPWQAAICELGLTAVDVTYCMFGAPHRKPTTIWTNAKELTYAADGGRRFCGGHYKCPKFRNHVQVKGTESSESSEFPEKFAQWLAQNINAEAARRSN